MIMADKNLDPNLRNHVGPSDILQQTMIKMVDGIDRFQGGSTPEFFGWLNQIIRNESRKFRRDLTAQKRDVRRHRSIENLTDDTQASFQPADEARTPRSDALANERIEVFHSALNRLTPDYATVIRLRNLEQLSFEQIAAELGRTRDSVSKLWYRAILKFKQEIKAIDGDSRQF